MRAIDTNVIVRFLLKDHPAQAEVAEQVVAGGAFISTTVLLEAGWLLGSRYALTRQQLVAALRALMSIDTLYIDAADLFAWAIDRYEDGADIADMLHLVSSASADSFATFDRALAKRAGDSPPLPIETLEA